MGFKRVLIANRGEIALRILRTLRDMGIEVAIIHGREDRLSLPVQMADIAYPNYRQNPLDSYLDIEAVVQAAKELKCDAVHPGYGFLAENAAFVARLEEEGITFIGPASGVITLLGDKIQARAAMEAAGLPTAKGSSEPIASAEVASALADDIGYPVIIKAAAGGGGIGMQIVHQRTNLKALSSCASQERSQLLATSGCLSKNTFRAPNTLNSRFLRMAKTPSILVNASVLFSVAIKNSWRKVRG